MEAALVDEAQQILAGGDPKVVTYGVRRTKYVPNRPDLASPQTFGRTNGNLPITPITAKLRR